MKAITVRIYADSVLYVKDELYYNDEAFEEFMEEYIADCDMDYYDIKSVKEHK